MKIVPFSLFILLGSYLFPDCDKYLDPAEKFRKADLVFIGEVLEISNMDTLIDVKLRSIRSLKGIVSQYEAVRIPFRDFLRGHKIQKNNFYLIYGNRNIEGMVEISTCFTFVEWSIAESEIASIEALKLCIDPSKVNASGICTMEYKPVCGCNNITYGNLCEAKNNGITSWSEGECIY